MECCSCSFTDTPGLTGGCGAGFAIFMGLVDYVLRSQCNIADPCGRAGKDDLVLNDEYDFIVVGAGVAGSLLGAHLSQDPMDTVLLLEAGPEEPTVTQLPSYAVAAVGTVLDWNYTTVAQENACLSSGGVCEWPRGKMVSGTGGMQGMMYTRGHRSIFDAWAQAGNTGWGYDDVLPYFKHSENNQDHSLIDEGYHGTDGALIVQQFSHHPPMAESVVEAGEQLGYRRGDLNGANQTGINIAQMMVSDGLRGSTSRLYLRPAADRENLHVSINSHVTRVLIEGDRAVGVEFVNKEGETKTVLARKEVILSAGAIGSPQILLLSGVGPRADLEELGIKVKVDLPVGHNLHNHIATGIGFFTNDTSFQTLTTEALNDFIRNRTGPMSGTGLTQTTGFFLSQYATNEVPDIQVFFDGFGAGCTQTGVQEECTDGTFGSCGARYIYARPTNIMPKSKGVLKLNSADPFDYPLMNPNYLQEQIDVEVLVDALKLVIRMTETDALQRWGFQVDKTPTEGCESFDWGSDDYWRCHVTRNTGAENHQGGTCKMGPATDPEAVVDPQLRVHGINNLRVIDASIFPYIPNSNPISSIIMAAEKGYDMIISSWMD